MHDLRMNCTLYLATPWTADILAHSKFPSINLVKMPLSTSQHF